MRYEVPNYLKINTKKTAEVVINFIRTYVNECGVSGAVLGLSGGADSSVLATLSVKALGPNKVKALIMPDKESNPKSVTDAVKVAEKLGLRYIKIQITPVIEAILKLFNEDYQTASKIPKGNIKARTRMILLYYLANKENLIVLGTSDRSEWLLGYFTKWGDAAADIYPLINLYKSQVRLLGDYLGLPEEIVWKPSSPDLWAGHKAVDELGADYDVIDKILYHYIDLKLDPQKIAEKLKINYSLVDAIVKRIQSNEHKRRIITGPKPVY